MSWTSTRTWWSVVREAAAEADRRCDGTVPWRPDDADVIASAADLRQALQYYWQLNVTAQGDDEESLKCFIAEHRGLHLVALGVASARGEAATQQADARALFRHAAAAVSRF